jgi:hypothetical protein
MQEIYRDQHTARKPRSKTEDIDERKGLALYHIAPGNLEVVEKHVVEFLAGHHKPLKKMPADYPAGIQTFRKTL